MMHSRRRRHQKAGSCFTGGLGYHLPTLFDMTTFCSTGARATSKHGGVLAALKPVTGTILGISNLSSR
jgi:hypothetical protein